MLTRLRSLLSSSLALAALAGPGARAADPAAPAPAATPEPAKAYAQLTDGRKVPLFDPSSASIPIARVGGEVVPLSDLTDALGAMHEQGSGSTAGKIEPRVLLDRIVDLRLVAREARAMGIAELPELKAAMASFEDKQLAQMLRRRVGATAKVDPKKIDAEYRNAVREWNVSSAMFAKEADATAFAAAASRPGARFPDLVKQAAAEKKAQGTGEPGFVAEQKLQKPVAQALRNLPAGKVAGPVAVGKQWVVLRQDGVRYPEDPDKRAVIAEGVAAPAREKVLRAYYGDLVKRYATVDRKLLAKLDLSAPKPGFEALMKDQRPLAKIQGEKPITVGDLADALGRKLYHASDRPESKKILNQKKAPALEDLLQKRLFTKQARVEKLDQTEAYREARARQEASVLVAAYVQKVLVPTVSVSDDEARKYYGAHKGEFTSPEMVKLEALAFTTEQAAQDAQRKARAGTDYRWLADNLPDQIPPEKRSLDFQPVPLAVTELPEGLAKAIAGAKPGECRAYSDSPTQNYLVHVVERAAPEILPYEKASGAIKAKLSGDKLDQAFKEAVGKLRQSERVEVLLARIEL